MEDFKKKLKHTGLGANKRTGVIIIALIVIPMALGLLAREQQARNIGGTDGDVLAEQRTVDVMEKLGEIMELPNENPQLVTVSDVTQLRDQKFFANAQNGDVVVIFSQAQKAVLYRPTTNKIIEIAVYTPPTGVPESESEAQPTPVQSLQDLIGGSPTPAPNASPAANNTQ